jgi:glycosyltransferase involved in cell wall biosynthesis
MISVIIPVFEEEGSLIELTEKIFKFVSLLDDFEIIFVDDGSKDNSLNIMKQIKNKDPEWIKIISFQGNFGKAAALSAGFKHARGDIIITMDGDLQDDPKEIKNFISKLKEGYDIVSGWKYERKDPISKKLPSKVFNWLTTYLTKVKLHDFNCGFKAYKSKVIKNLDLYGELHRYIPAIVSTKGYKVGEIKVKHHERKHGVSKYGFSRIFKGFFDLITVTYFMRYSKKPLHFFGALGLISFGLGFVGGLYLFIIKLMGNLIGNRPLLTLVAVLMIIGVQFISLGLIAEMITKDRRDEDYVIKEMII